MSVLLANLQQQYQTQASLLLDACVQKQKEHPLLNKGIFNVGIWRSAWMNTDKENLENQDAAIFSLMLATKEIVVRKGKNSVREESIKENLWPWCNRETVLSQKNTVEWLEILLALDAYSTIFVDIIPDLGIWICDIFNYIPRNIWTVAARLLARLYRSSKKLFFSLYPEVSEEAEQAKNSFFFSHIDNSLKELFDFSKPLGAKNTGSIRTVFCSLEKEDANQKYGEHSHVHRHSLYLLFQVALLDSDWYSVVFDSSQKSFRKHFFNIKDDSCLSVFYPALLDICYFTGEQTTFDWTLFLKITGVDSSQLAYLPNISTQPYEYWQEEASKLIQQHICTDQALKVNTQLVVECFKVYKRNSYESTHIYASFFQELIQWICSAGIDSSWGDYSYDMLAFCIDELQNHTRASFLEERIQELQSYTRTEKRHLLLSSYHNFIFQEKYRLLCEDERKQSFFDLWFLLKEEDIFSEAFGTHLLEKGKDLVFSDVQGIHGSFLDSVRSLFSPKDLGKKEYTKIMLLLAILIHGQNLSVHQNELANLIRDAALGNVLVFDTNAKSSFFAKGTKDLSSVGPVAVWLLNTPIFTGYQTPILFQIIQHFLMECRSETQKLHFFWRIGLFDPSASIYSTISKNLQFPYHLLGEKSVQYTKIDWNQLSNYLKDHIIKRKLITKEYQKISDIEDEQQRKEIYEKMTESFLSFSSIWGENIEKYSALFEINERVSWPKAQWENLVDFWLSWMSKKEPQDFFDLEQRYSEIHLFFENLFSFLNNIIHDVPMESIKAFERTFKRIYTALDVGKYESLEEDTTLFLTYSPKILFDRVPIDISFLYECVFARLQKVIHNVVHKEKMYKDWNKEIFDPKTKFEKKISYLKNDDGYWYYVQKHLEMHCVEKNLALSWVDALGNSAHTKWKENNFSAGLSAFQEAMKTYPQNIKIPFVILSVVVVEQQKKLGKEYYPLIKCIGDRLNDGSKIQFKEQESLDLLDKRLCVQDIYTLANQFWMQFDTNNALRIWLRSGYLMLPFVSSVVSLTLLLDFGSNLIKVPETFGWVTPFTGVLSMAIFFGYPWFSKHIKIGMSFPISLQNLLPSFTTSVICSGFCTWIWMLSEGGPTEWTHAGVLLFFFTTIVVSATKGAFDTSES